MLLAGFSGADEAAGKGAALSMMLPACQGSGSDQIFYVLGRQVAGAIEAVGSAIGRFAALDHEFGLLRQVVCPHLDLLLCCDVIEVSTLNLPTPVW